MKQCNFCTQTEDNVSGNVLWKGMMNSRICVNCAILILTQMIDKQDKELKKLEDALTAIRGIKNGSKV